MTGIYNEIERWLNQPENDCPEERARLLIKINRLIYDFVKDKGCEHGKQEWQGLANILEVVEDYRTDMFIEQRRKKCGERGDK